MAKCEDFIKHVKMTAQNQSLDVKCVNTSSHEKCIEKIKSKEADLVTLDGGDVYTAGKIRNLASMMVLEAKLEARRLYAKHHAIYCLETTLCFETTSRKASKFQPAFLFLS